MDPAKAAPGYYYSHLYCKPGPAPVAIFSVTVGNIDGTDVSKAPTASRQRSSFNAGARGHVPVSLSKRLEAAVQ